MGAHIIREIVKLDPKNPEHRAKFAKNTKEIIEKLKTLVLEDYQEP